MLYRAIEGPAEGGGEDWPWWAMPVVWLGRAGVWLFGKLGVDFSALWNDLRGLACLAGLLVIVLGSLWWGLR